MKITENLVQEVWVKARGMPEADSSEWRKDQCGAWIHRGQFNNEDSEYGWKIVNVVPGGPEILENLEPFHLNNTFDIENGKPKCAFTADRTGLFPTQSINQPRNIST